MADLAVFPDIEQALITLLAGFGTTGTVVPADLTSHMPYVKVARFGGGDDRFTDTARVDVDCFAATRAVAFSTAEGIRQRLLGYPHSVIDVGTIDHVETLTGPVEVPWADPNVRRFTSSYAIATRR